MPSSIGKLEIELHIIKYIFLSKNILHTQKKKKKKGKWNSLINGYYINLYHKKSPLQGPGGGKPKASPLHFGNMVL